MTNREEVKIILGIMFMAGILFLMGMGVGSLLQLEPAKVNLPMKHYTHMDAKGNIYSCWENRVDEEMNGCKVVLREGI